MPAPTGNYAVKGIYKVQRIFTINFADKKRYQQLYQLLVKDYETKQYTIKGQKRKTTIQ